MTCAQSGFMECLSPEKLLTSQLLLVLVAALMDALILISHVNKLCMYIYINLYSYVPS